MLLRRQNQEAHGEGIQGSDQPAQPHRRQVRGVKGMVEHDAYCVDILTQVSAVSAALDAFSRTLMESHIRTCVVDDIRRGNDEVVDELIDTLRKLMK